jgi:hypothetical protein
MNFYSRTATFSISSGFCAWSAAAAVCLAPTMDLCSSLDLGYMTDSGTCDDSHDNCCDVQSDDLRSQVAVDSASLVAEFPANLNASYAYCWTKAWVKLCCSVAEVLANYVFRLTKSQVILPSHLAKHLGNQVCYLVIQHHRDLTTSLHYFHRQSLCLGTCHL